MRRLEIIAKESMFGDSITIYLGADRWPITRSELMRMVEHDANRVVIEELRAS